MTIYEALLIIKREGPPRYSAGICANVHDLCGKGPRSYLVKWGGYPVGGVGEYVSGGANRTLWDNPRRWEILDDMIEFYTPWYVKLWRYLKLRGVS